ncbi:MAG: SurA N-terminal domain-containing protein [Candidatus Methylomirabilaceae bacterium]
MRKHAKALHAILWLVIITFIGTTFLVWGFRSTSGDLGPDSIATVEGERVPYSEYQQLYRRHYEQYQKALGDKFDEKVLERVNLKNQVLNSLISRHLLLGEARRLGIVVGPDELVAEITNLPAFRDQQGFSRDRYLRTLESSRQSTERFEESLRQELMIRKVEQWVKAAVSIHPEEAWDAFRFNRTSVKVEYLLFSDPKAQEATIQRLIRLVNDEKKPWEEIIKASGLKPISAGFFSLEQEVKGLPEEDDFKEVALALKKGEVSPVIQGAKSHYVIRVIDRKEADRSEYDRDRVLFERALLNRKREQAFGDWVRQLRARAKIKIDEAIL